MQLETIEVEFLGRQPYRETWARMEARRDEILAGAAREIVYLVEHDPVVTLGRSADRAHVLDASLDVVTTNRGGDVTAHGPGQLVIYPVVRLAKGVVAFVEAVGGAIAGELDALGVRGAAWRRDPAGVWVGSKKVAACGLHIKRRVAAHGFALNVASSARRLFDGIVPCGLPHAVTTIEDEIGRAPPLEALSDALADRIAAALGRSIFSRSCRSSLALD